MSYPKTIFKQTIQSEVARLLFVANQISLGFYKDKRISVLPDKNADYSGKLVIYFPQFDYLKIENFWERVKQTEDNMVFDDYPEIVTDLTNLLEKEINIDEERLSRIESEWNSIKTHFWEIIKVIFPDTTEKIETVTINVSQYGSRGSYHHYKEGDKNILIYIRDDSDVSNIAWGILSALLSKNMGEIIHSWEEIMSCVDIIMTQTEFHALFPNYRPALSVIKSTPIDYLLESDIYLSKLGISFEKQFKQVDGELYFKNKALNIYLTANQIKILKLLFNLEGKIVSTYEIGDELWSDSEEFSLWAVNKTMQRLRSKLITLGASPLTLKPIRGKGYILNTSI